MKTIPEFALSDKHAKSRSKNRAGGKDARSRKAKTQQPGFQYPRWIFLVLFVGVLALTTVVYARTAWHPFVNFDDGEYVFDNVHVNGGLSWSTARWALFSSYAGNWHPLTWLSHALDCQLFGLNAGRHHIVNVLLHVLNTTLLFLLLTRLTGYKWRSLAVAALFALHPVNVESVAWVAERKNLLCTLFFLLAIGAYAWYVRHPSRSRYIGVAALFVLGLAAKPQIVTLPFVLLLMDYWPLGRVQSWSPASLGVRQLRLPHLLLEKVPLLALSIVSGVVTLVAQRSAGAVANAAGWPVSWRIENAIHSYAVYLLRAFAPIDLAPFYPATELHWWQVGWAAVVLAGVSWLVWKLRSDHPYVVFGWLWFVITLIPVIGIIQVGAQATADRYMYIPLIGIFIAVVWSVTEIARSRSWSGNWKYAPAIATVVVLAAISFRQVNYWKSSYDLWAHTLQVTTNNAVAEENLAVSLLDLGREDEAFPHFQRVLVLRPEDAVALLNTGNYLEKQGQHREAIDRFEKVRDTSHDPEKLTGAYRGLGVAFAQMGDGKNARVNFQEALRLNPNGSTELYNLSLLEIRDGIDNLAKAVATKPSPEGYLQLGQLLQEDQRSNEALLAYESALKLNPKFTEAKAALSSLKQATNGN